MTQDQPSRLDRLEALLADVGGVVLQIFQAGISSSED